MLLLGRAAALPRGGVLLPRRIILLLVFWREILLVVFWREILLLGRRKRMIGHGCLRHITTRGRSPVSCSGRGWGSGGSDLEGAATLFKIPPALLFRDFT